MYLLFKIQIHEQYMGLILKVEVIYLAEKVMWTYISPFPHCVGK